MDQSHNEFDEMVWLMRVAYIGREVQIIHPEHPHFNERAFITRVEVWKDRERFLVENEHGDFTVDHVDHLRLFKIHLTKTNEQPGQPPKSGA
jgi:hypothetical protein